MGWRDAVELTHLIVLPLGFFVAKYLRGIQQELKNLTIATATAETWRTMHENSDNERHAETMSITDRIATRLDQLSLHRQRSPL